jgi:hypothetical protein
MLSRMLLPVIGACVVALPATAMAGPCDAHFTFDGDLSDASGGQSAQFVDRDGVTPSGPGAFVPGRFGQALRLDGETIGLSPLDLQTETCPQVTVTAWIKLESVPAGYNNLFSTGYGRGPRMAVAGYNLSAWGGSNEIRASGAVRPGIWIFVAGVWDYTAGTHRLYWRDRSLEEPLGDNPRPPQEGTWIGAYAYGTNMQGIASGILIDELRFHGRALSDDEIRAIQGEGVPALGDCNCGGDPTATAASASSTPEATTGTTAPGAADADVAATLGNVGPTRPLEFPEGSTTSSSGGATAAASGTGSSTPTQQQAQQATGVPHPVGEPSFTGVAGFTGGNKRILDLEDRFLNEIGWDEGQDIPCLVGVRSAATNADPEPKRGELDVGCPVKSTTIGLSVPYSAFSHSVQIQPSVIASLQVCSSFSSRRLKGLSVSGMKVRDDGSLTYVPAEDEERLTNCSRWSAIQLCDGDRVATGVVVHSDERSSAGAEQVVGLQLVCRRVGLQ